MTPETMQLYWVVAIAVAGPVVGSAIGVAIHPQESTISKMLGFAGGAMLAISFLELLPQSIGLCGVFPSGVGLFIGLLIMVLLNDLIPHPKLEQGDTQKNELKQTALLTIAAIFLHNLPEGMAIASGAAIDNQKTVLVIALAIATHNIPEGICTSAPYYYTTGKRLKSFLLSSSTAIPVLVGFLLGQSIFQDISPFVLGMTIASVAGLMIHISCEELIPTAQNQRHTKGTMVFLMLGILFVMILGLLD